MRNVLVLTKSPISEQVLEHQLQQLDCEVYVSRRVLENCLCDEVDLGLIQNFEIILISETVSNNELAWLLPVIKEARAYIIRKSDGPLLAEEKKSWAKQGILGWINVQNTLEELRESIDSMMSFKDMKSSVSNIVTMRRIVGKKDFNTLMLTHKERKLLTSLFKANGSTVSREELSYQIWDQDPCNSTMTQLSTITARLKAKLADQGITGETIQTIWGVGYKLSDDFYNQVSADENYVSEM